MNNIIQVVNQHAKLLDQSSHEILLKANKRDISDMFNIASHGFPYEKVVARFGHDPSVPLPRSVYITDQLMKHNVKMNVALPD